MMTYQRANVSKNLRRALFEIYHKYIATSLLKYPCFLMFLQSSYHQ